MDLPFLSPLVFNQRFCHITEQIFQQLDIKSLKNCREVKTSWERHINAKNFSWIRITNIPRLLRNRNTYLHTAANKKQLVMFRIIFDNAEIKNPKSKSGRTPLHLVCQNGDFRIAEILMQVSELNSKEKWKGAKLSGRKVWIFQIVFVFLVKKPITD